MEIEPMDRTEYGTVVLLVGYLATFAVAYVVDEMIVWIAWAALAVIVVGAVTIAFNRSKSAE